MVIENKRIEAIINYLDRLNKEYLNKRNFCMQHHFELDQKLNHKIHEILADISFEIRLGDYSEKNLKNKDGNMF